MKIGYNCCEPDCQEIAFCDLLDSTLMTLYCKNGHKTNCFFKNAFYEFQFDLAVVAQQEQKFDLAINFGKNTVFSFVVYLMKYFSVKETETTKLFESTKKILGNDKTKLVDSFVGWYSCFMKESDIFFETPKGKGIYHLYHSSIELNAKDVSDYLESIFTSIIEIKSKIFYRRRAQDRYLMEDFFWIEQHQLYPDILCNVTKDLTLFEMARIKNTETVIHILKEWKELRSKYYMIGN